MHCRHLPFVAVAVVLALLSAGCGDDESTADRDPGADPTSGATQVPTDPTPPDGTPQPVDTGTCSYLDVDAVSEVMATEMRVTSDSPGACYFDPVDGGTAAEKKVIVNYTKIGIDPQTYADGTREICSGDVTELDAAAPDQIGFACVGIGPQGFLFDGADSVVVEVDGLADDAAGVAAAADLLGSVTFG